MNRKTQVKYQHLKIKHEWIISSTGHYHYCCYHYCSVYLMQEHNKKNLYLEFFCQAGPKADRIEVLLLGLYSFDFRVFFNEKFLLGKYA